MRLSVVCKLIVDDIRSTVRSTTPISVLSVRQPARTVMMINQFENDVQFLTRFVKHSGEKNKSISYFSSNNNRSKIAMSVQFIEQVRRVESHPLRP